MDTKLCVVCGTDLPLLRRSDRRYCGGRCRIRAHRVRAEVERRKPRRTQEKAHTAVNVVAAAAAGLSVANLNWDLLTATAHRQNLEKQVARAETELASVQKERDAAARERDAAVEEARQAREDAQALRLQLKHEQQQRERVQAQAEQLQDALRRTKKSLHDALVKGDEFYENWQATQTALDDERSRHAYEEHGESGDRLAQVHAQVDYLEQYAHDLEARLTGSEVQRIALEGDAQRAAQLTARVATLEKQLQESREKHARATKKLTRRKNASKQLDAGQEEESSGSLLRKAGAVLAGVAAGAMATKLAGRAPRKVLPATAPKGYLPGRSKP